MRLAALALALLLGACAPRVQDLAPARQPASFDAGVFLAVDGAKLPATQWPARRPVRAVALALHGVNDYRDTFAGLGPYLARQGIAVYAYDQRGFGAAPAPGIWAGTANLVRDVRSAAAALRARHPGLPLYLIGNSMGGAIAAAALADAEPADFDGAVLSAPAVWGGEALHPFLRASLWLVAHTQPWNHATGRSLRRIPSDNIHMLRALGRDPLIIKRTRIDAVYGLTQLMGAGQAAAPFIKVPLLLLYGGNDQIVPPAPVARFRGRLRVPHVWAFYPEGYHMLLRSHDRHTVWADIASWILDPGRPLPSGRGEAIAPRAARR